MSLQFLEEEHGVQSKVDIDLIVHPRIIESTSASCIHTACNTSFELLSLDGLARISAKVKLFVVSEVPDNVSANVRRKAYVASKLPMNCLYGCSMGCCAHRAHRIVSNSVDEAHIIGDIHAVSMICGVPRYRCTMLQLLHKMVDDELEVLDFQNERWAVHAESVVQHTLGREHHFVRGSRDVGAIASPPCESKALFERMAHVQRFLNGDWRCPHIQHVEKGCCPDRAAIVQNVSAAIANSGMIMGLNSELPSKNRWGSCSAHLSKQVCGHMCHNVLHRLLLATFPRWGVEGPDEEGGRDDDDYRKMLRSKAWRATHAFAEESSRRDAALTSWLVVSMDDLWLRLQHLDHAGSALLDAVLPRTSPFLHAQIHLGRSLNILILFITSIGMFTFAILHLTCDLLCLLLLHLSFLFA